MIMTPVTYGLLAVMMGMAQAGIVNQHHGHGGTSTQNFVSYHHGGHYVPHGQQGFQYSVSHGAGYLGGVVGNGIEGAAGAQGFDQGLTGGTGIGGGLIAGGILEGVSVESAALGGESTGSYAGAAGFDGAGIGGADFGGYAGSSHIGAYSAGANLGIQSGAFAGAHSGAIISSGVETHTLGSINAGPYPAAAPAQTYGVPNY